MRRYLAPGLGLLLLALALAADDPFVGTWKLNAGKSSLLNSQFAQAKEVKVKIEINNNTMHAVWDIIGNDGKPVGREYTMVFDGKDYPVTGNRNIDITAWTRVDRNTLDSVGKKNGQFVGGQHTTVSTDGKTMTIVTKGKNQKGEDSISTGVFEKQ